MYWINDLLDECGGLEITLDRYVMRKLEQYQTFSGTGSTMRCAPWTHHI